MMKFEYLIVFICILLITFASCDNKRVFEKFEEIPPGGWNKNTAVEFHITISDSIQEHNLFINVRNDINYNYSNLWLFIENTSPIGNTSIDTFEVLLAEPSGKWLGEGFGGKKLVQTRFKQNVQFPVSGEYKIRISQGMRDETLEGINDIGFRVAKTE